MRRSHNGFIQIRFIKLSSVSEWYATNPRFDNLVNEISEEPKVLIGIIDVGGFDFAHPDFLDGQGGTRFVKIWDQGGTFRNA
ncbi:hypothetical protein ACFLTE_11590, partial [Bacteroidota bacterium]